METTRTTKATKEAWAEIDRDVKALVARARHLPPPPARKPTAGEKKFRLSLKRSMELDKALEPTLNAIYRRVLEALDNETDRELFRLYPILHMGSVLSAHAPGQLVATDLTWDYLKLYTMWAKKAEKMLLAVESEKPTDQPSKG